MLLLFAATVAWAAPPEAPKTVPARVGEVVSFSLKVPAGKKLGMHTPHPDSDLFIARLWSEDPAVYNFMAQPKKAGKFVIVWWTADETSGVNTVIDAGGTPPVPPDPPAPTTVTSFRTFIVYEAGQTMSATQNSIIYGKDVEAALNQSMNGLAVDKTGWRRTDKDADPSTMLSGFKDVWAAAKPKITAVPCIVFQVDSKITIEPLPPTIADTTAMIAKYRGGK